MNNADMPAQPLPNGADNRPYKFMEGEKIQPNHPVGLTKREHFAGLIMQAIIIGNNADICALGIGAAKDAIKSADALLKELEQ